MRTLVHLSDLHFGRIERELVEPLADTVRQVRPDITVISGDFTQDARDEEFAQARRFLDRLPEPRLAVPGNHDLPFYNPWRRMLRGLDGYREWISADFEPCYADDEVTVAGANTARLFPIRGGRINEKQIERIAARMRQACPRATRVLVTHHPFDLPETFGARELAGRAALAMDRLARCVDVLLAGHMHIAHAGHTALRYKHRGCSAIFVQAGTATSSRVRGERNSFNVIRIDRPRIDIQRFEWVGQRRLFVASVTDAFLRTPGGWVRMPEERVLRAG